MATIDKIRLSGSTYDIIDATAIHSLEGYATTGDVTASTAALAETIANQHYQTSGDVQNAISGKTDESAFTAHTSDSTIHVTTAQTAAWNAKAEVSDIPSVTPYADSVKYNSTTHYVEFYHGTTAGTKVFEYDASPFLVDGMVESVVITSITSGGSEVQVLEITWNSAAGGQVTDIPLSDIFNPDNYYTKQETNDLIDQKIVEASGVTSGVVQTMIDNSISGKADTSAVTTVNDALTAHTSNGDIHVTTSDKSTWSGKQDALVSGTNIKTVNNTSLLGSGNISTLQASLDGTTLVFS